MGDPINQSSITYDITSRYKHCLKHLDRHVPNKTKRVKSKHLLCWYTAEIAHARHQRDFNTRKQNWNEYKQYRNLIKKGKRKVQGVPQSQAAAHPRHENEEDTNKNQSAYRANVQKALRELSLPNAR